MSALDHTSHRIMLKGKFFQFENPFDECVADRRQREEFCIRSKQSETRDEVLGIWASIRASEANREEEIFARGLACKTV